jgi:FG-GAP-like repeat
MKLLLALLIAGQPWTRHTIDNSSRGADGVKLIDINGDGRPDVTTAVYYNEGRVGVRSPWPQVTVGNVRAPEDAVFADLDADLGFDIVSACEGTQRALFVHWAPRDFDRYFDPKAWTTAVIPASRDRMMWMFAVPMQVDGRHGVDLVAGGKGPGAEIGWMESAANPRQLELWRWHPLRAVGWIMSIHTLDMDSDGDQDILFSDRKGDRSGIHWLENPTWNMHTVGATGREVMFIDVADFDGDGRHDIVAAVKPRETHVFKRRGKDGRQWDVEKISWPATVGTAKAVRLADINNDGRVDLVYSAEEAHSELRGVAWMDLATRALHDISGAAGTKYDLLELYDFDADGDLDLLTTEETDGLGVVWYENPL